MYLVVIAWMYVVLMMAVAEATSTTGTVLGALVTFFLYGVGPVGLVVYVLGAPGRSKAIKKREAAARAAHLAAGQTGVAAAKAAPSPAPASGEPDAGSHAAGGAETVSLAAPLTVVASDSSIPPVREK